MKVLGIIAEYNPMHNGHIYHIKKAKEITGADYVIVVMSGSFTQTGNIALLNKFTRADIAVKYGADLVIELPTIYAVSSSEFFATGAINLLNNLGIVDYICFGSECKDIKVLDNIVTKLIKYEDEIWEYIKLDKKNSTFAKSRNDVLSRYLDKDEMLEISRPNNILGIEYIKALRKINSNITPFLIKRKSSNFNEIILNKNSHSFTSATSIRESVKLNKLDEIKPYIPSETLDSIHSFNYLLNKDLLSLIKYSVITMGKEKTRDIHEVTEGLENRIFKYISEAKNYDDLIDLIKSKRYIENKIKRILINILLKIEKTTFNNIISRNISYANVLAISKNGSLLLSNISKVSKIPVFTSINDKLLEKQEEYIKYMIYLDIYASNIHNILSQSNLNNDYTNKI